MTLNSTSAAQSSGNLVRGDVEPSDSTGAHPLEEPGPAGDVESSEEAEQPRGPLRVLLEWVLIVVLAMSVAWGVKTYVLAHFIVDGTSMMETLHPGDRVFVNRLSYRLHEPGRGDVVVLHESEGTIERDLIKRVIGLPGETVEIRDCVVTIDGQPLDEPYLSATVRASTAWCELSPVTVPDGDVFVMGDNRPASSDSRSFGPISESELVGRAFVLFWPRQDIQWL